MRFVDMLKGVNLVYRHPSGGALYQGDADDVRAMSGCVSEIQVVVLAAIEFQPELPECYEVIRTPLIDSVSLSDQAEALTTAIADVGATKIAAALLQGKSCVSTCAAGLNRSALVSALALLKLGVDAKQAVYLIRSARGQLALCNHQFVQIINSVGDRLKIAARKTENE